MPVKDLINGMNDVPDKVEKVADGLMYRDFRVVGVLLNKLKLKKYLKLTTIEIMCSSIFMMGFIATFIISIIRIVMK